MSNVARNIIITVVVILALFFLIGRASAWTFSVTGSGVCNQQTSEYDITWIINNPENEIATVASSSRPSVSGDIPANDSEQYTESVAGTSTNATLEVELDWPSDKGQPSKTASVDLSGDCKAPTPPVTPPVTPVAETPTPVNSTPEPIVVEEAGK